MENGFNAVFGSSGGSSSSSGVQSVTGLATDNTDPLNPVIDIAIDTSLSGAGTPASPLMVNSSALSFVQSVTGLATDNTDPLNPVVAVAVDGTTITGDGTPANPLASTPVYRDFGGFFSQVIQSVSSPNTESQIAIEQTNYSNGVFIGTDGSINFSRQGMYMIELTLQFVHQAPITNDYIYVWFKQGGFNQYMTTRQMILNATIRSGVMTLSYMVAIYPFPSALPTISLFWSATSTDIVLETITTPSGEPQSDTPSVICNVFQIY